MISQDILEYSNPKDDGLKGIRTSDERKRGRLRFLCWGRLLRRSSRVLEEYPARILDVSSGTVWTRMTDGTSIVRYLGLDLTELPYQHCA
jgi:hypothetical protein